MKQVVQNYRTGELTLEEIPPPHAAPSQLLVRTLYSAISAGTEKTKVTAAKMPLWQKAKSRPDLVRKVIEKAKKEGWLNTYQMVRDRLEEPVPLGYSLVGQVEAAGEWTEGFQAGDWVACAGQGFANHAELNAVPFRLAAKIPPGAPKDQAAFTTIGAIALQGVRQADVRIGERIVVIGFGLLGQITALLLKANGCFVFAVDTDPSKLESAKQKGTAEETALANDPTLFQTVDRWSRGRGADACILTASTPSSTPLEQAGIFLREKGRVVIVGAVGTQFEREPFYKKEIEIRMARSYGPGRYDPLYELVGLDYPSGYVRFTEQRNMEAFLDLLAAERLGLGSLITHRFPFGKAEEAFALLRDPKASYLGILLEYASAPEAAPCHPKAAPCHPKAAPCLGFIGMGNYATSKLLPALQNLGELRFKKVATANGLKAALKGEKLGFEETAQNAEDILDDPEIGTVFVVTRHDSHAAYVRKALANGKNVFTEKPLCLRPEELEDIRNVYDKSRGILMVGFNRRFSPFAREIRNRFPNGAEHIVCRVNAGILDREHWLHIPEIGGGRLLGEGCHFVDLAAYLAGSPVRNVSAHMKDEENFHLQLGMENGALASIQYFSSGSPELSKEYFEAHGFGLSVICDDFRSLRIAGGDIKKTRQDKGQASMLEAFIRACRSGDRAIGPIPAESVWNTMEALFAAGESARTGRRVTLPLPRRENDAL